MRGLLIKLRYEYWPWWLFFLPLIPIYLVQAIRLRSLVYFTWVNPSIEYGGFFGESKKEILSHIPDKYKALSLYVSKENPAEKVLQKIKDKGIKFPVIYKPNIGERGDGVKKIKTEKGLLAHLNYINEDYIIQEYIDFEYEFGVFYHRIPGTEKGKVTSITGKKFMSVKGNGKLTIKELMAKSDRYYLQIKRLVNSGSQKPSYSPPMDEVVLLEPIGNHCLGTEFIDRNELINEKVHKIFNQISSPFKGFYYGRYDLKVSKLSDLETGENIKIFELNGVSSEPGHIYDAEYTIFKAYKDIYSHWKIMFKIAKEQKKKGVEAYKTKEIFKVARAHFFN